MKEGFIITHADGERVKSVNGILEEVRDKKED